MDLHHTFRSIHRYLEVPQTGVLKHISSHIFTKVGDLIGSTKTQYKNLKFGMILNWHKYNFHRYTEMRFIYQMPINV